MASSDGRVLIAAATEVVALDLASGNAEIPRGLTGRPTCLAADPLVPGRAWCGTRRDGVFRSDDGGRSWYVVGLTGQSLMSLTASPVQRDLVWAGTEPSEVWCSPDGGGTWERMPGLESLPSSGEWSFPPKPETHHVRWIACHPHDAMRLWVAVEAGALVSTADGGRSWRDRVPGGPWDTHELALHPASPETLRVAAGDGYFESEDAGVTWRSPSIGLEVGYLRSVAIDPARPQVVLVSAATGPYSAYVAGRSDGRVYRRTDGGRWERVRRGWPDPPASIAPLLIAGSTAGELWAADERGVHLSEDSGASWQQVAGFRTSPDHLRGLALVR